MDFKELTHNLKHKFEHLLNNEETHEGETCQDHYLHHEGHNHDHDHEHEHHHEHGHHHVMTMMIVKQSSFILQD